MKVKVFVGGDTKTGKTSDVYFLVSAKWVKVVYFSQPPEDLSYQLKKQARIGMQSLIKNRFMYAVQPKLIEEFII